MKIINFTCNENLSDYVDSMLFDSGTVIATMTAVSDKGNNIEISLEVRGDVEINYRDNIYYSPSEFPEALFDLIKDEHYYYLNEDVEVIDSNWFEFIYTISNNADINYSEGIMCDEDISECSAEDIKKLMLDILHELDIDEEV